MWSQAITKSWSDLRFFFKIDETTDYYQSRLPEDIGEVLMGYGIVTIRLRLS